MQFANLQSVFDLLFAFWSSKFFILLFVSWFYRTCYKPQSTMKGRHTDNIWESYNIKIIYIGNVN